jgi:hypothetical protein
MDGNKIVVSLHSMASLWLQVRLNTNWKTRFFELAVLHMQSYLDSTDHSDDDTWQEALLHVDNICNDSQHRNAMLS